MAKQGKDAPAEAPDTGASCIPGLTPEQAVLLEQVGEIVVAGRLYTSAVDAEAPEDQKESEPVD
jgi:hypothetical protein